MKKVSSLSYTLLSFHFSSCLIPPFFFPLGLRAFHSNRNTSTPARGLGNWFGLYLYHCKVTAASHTAGGQESHPGLS